VNATLAELLVSLHDVAEFHWAALMLTDTETMLPFGGVVEGLAADACVPFWDNELLDPDFSKFNALARSSEPVVTLADATDGDLSRSPRFQKLYSPLGGGDELRVAFTTGNTCWAVASLIRRADTGQFTAIEMQSVRDLVPVAARKRGLSPEEVVRLSATSIAIIGAGLVAGPTSALIADLAARGVAILLISSELPELIGLCHRVAVMRAGTICGVLPGATATAAELLAMAVGQ